MHAIPAGTRRTAGLDSNPPQSLCFGHPAGELGSFDPSAFVFSGRIPGGRHRRPDFLPTEGWTHLAIVVAPDGEARLLLNGEEVARSIEPLTLDAGLRWQVEILGRAADTQLLIRDLVLWEGMRY